MENKNPLSPHIQIYSWHISSLVSISHRITGVMNIIFVILICFWIASLFLGKDGYEIILSLLNSYLGKFVIIGITWSFSFQILSEIRHWFWDMGYGFELKTANFTGALTIVLSIVFTILFYFLGRIII